MQLFVLSFDERRELLFWDPRMLESTLYITFGLDAERAKRADALTHTIEAAESRARNFQWQATNLRRQLETLEHAGDEVAEDASDAVERHRALEAEHTEIAAQVERLQVELADTHLKIAELTAQLQAARRDYDALWSERLHGYADPTQHPVITATLANQRCAVCGTEGASVAQTVNERLEASRCPLCNSELETREVPIHSERENRLLELDKQIVQTGERLAGAEAAAARISRNLEQQRTRLREVVVALADFEDENLRALVGASSSVGGLAAVAGRYRAQIGELQGQRDGERTRRDRARRELKPLLDELTAVYAAAEDEFVPRFQSLAREFLGMELDVDLDVRRSNVGLILTVQGTRRRAQDTLSESQRFFIDIALRMALAQQISAGDSPACLYIDTPEGSLDIAYESRAGQMFALFVQAGFQIIMTANINTSQLLHRLAELCGPDDIQLERMTEWTSLTEVQAAEERLFEDAWTEIKRAAEGTA